MVGGSREGGHHRAAPRPAQESEKHNRKNPAIPPARAPGLLVRAMGQELSGCSRTDEDNALTHTPETPPRNPEPLALNPKGVHHKTLNPKP